MVRPHLRLLDHLVSSGKLEDHSPAVSIRRKFRYDTFRALTQAQVVTDIDTLIETLILKLPCYNTKTS